MDSPNEVTGEYDPLDKAIAEYVQAAEAGAPPDRTAFIARHLDLAEPLRAFFTAYDRLGRQAMAFHMPNPDATQSLDSTSSKSNLPAVRYLGDYELLSEIARGGMGVVFKARQVSLNRTVAVKMILAGDYATEQAVQRFRAEAEAAANLDHPNILPIYEVGEHEGHQYFSMKLVDGESLAAKIVSLQSQPRSIALLMATLSRAVNFAHQRGILHRDLKPGNVLIDSDGTPFVTDFGLAKKVDSDDGGTRTGAVVGTPSYMAPEQARGEKGLTTAVDVYSLGAILYELLAGRPAFKNDAVFSTIKDVIETEAADPRTFCPTADQDLSVIALKCLEKDPARRYATAGELADDLERRLRNEPITARPVTRRERTLKWMRRNPAVAGLAAGLLLVTAIAFAGITWGLVRAENSRMALSKSNEDLAKSVEDLGKSNDDLAKAENEARQRAAEAEYKGYLSDVNLARQLDKANDLAGMRVALDRCPPPLRKWEWYYLNSLARPKMDTIEADGLPTTMEYSPDGKLFAFLTSKGILTIRDRATGGTLFRTEDSLGGADSVVGLTFLHENAELAVVSYRFGQNFYNGRQGGNCQVLLVDLKTGSQRKLIVPLDPSNPVRGRFDYLAMAYDSSGRLLGAAQQNIAEKDKDGIPIRQFGYLIRDVLADKTIATLPVYAERAGFHLSTNGIAFSPDGSRFAAGISDSGMRESISIKPLPKNQKGTANDKKSEAMPDTKFDAATEAAAAGFKPGVTIWDIPTGKVLRQASSNDVDERLRNLHFCPHGEMCIVNGRQLDIVNFDPKVPSDSIAGASGNLLAVAFQGKERIWTGGEDRFIRAYDAVTHAKLLELRGCANTIARIAVAPDGNEVTAVTIERLKSRATLCRFDVAGLGHNNRQFGGGQNIAESSLSADGRRALGLSMWIQGDKSQTTQLTMYDLDAGTEILPIPAVFSRAICLPNKGYAHAVEAKHAHAVENKIKLFDARGQPDGEMTLPEYEKSPGQPLLAVTADGGKLVGWMSSKMSNPAAPENELQLASWNLKTRQPGKILTAHPKGIDPELQKIERIIALPWCCAVHPNGRWVATGSIMMMVKDGSIQFRGLLIVWDLDAGKEIYRRKTDEPLRAVAWDKQDRIVAAGGTELGGTVHTWDFTTGAEAHPLRGHSGPILGLALSPDGRLATAGADRVVKVWDIATGRELLTLDGFAQAVTNVAFTPDGADLVASTGVDIFPLMFEVHGPGEKPIDWPVGEVRIFHGSR